MIDLVVAFVLFAFMLVLLCFCVDNVSRRIKIYIKYLPTCLILGRALTTAVSHNVPALCGQVPWEDALDHPVPGHDDSYHALKTHLLCRRHL